MEFEQAWREIEPFTMLGQDRGRILWDLAKDATWNHGTSIAELGVYKGGTAMLMRHAAPLRPLHLFDTFDGHPDSSRAMDNEGSHPAKRFADARLPYFPEGRVTYHVGEFPESVEGMSLPPLCLVHIDADLYDSVRAACRIFWLALEHGGYLVFDDYGFPDCVGAKRAVDEWVAVDPAARKLVLPGTGQAWVRKP